MGTPVEFKKEKAAKKTPPVSSSSSLTLNKRRRFTISSSLINKKPPPLLLYPPRDLPTIEEFEQNQKLDPPISASHLSGSIYNMPILYCYDDIKWECTVGCPASSPNLVYSKDCLCIYAPINIDDSSVEVVSFKNGTKTHLILSFDTAFIGRKWYGLSLTDEGECNSNQKLITSLLQDASLSWKARECSCVKMLGDTVYRIVFIESELRSELQVLDTNTSSWKNLMSLEKVRFKPWIISIGDNIYILGADAGSEDDGLYTINDIEVFEKHKWKRHPLIPMVLLENWLSCYVFASESLNKIVIGSCEERCLYLYDVPSFQVEKLDLSQYGIYWLPNLLPAVVGHNLFWFFEAHIVSYGLLNREFWKGTIDNLDKRSFFDDNVNRFDFPSLIDLGDETLCLICYKSDKPKMMIHCCVFDVPEFTTESGKNLLRGRVHSIHKFNIEHGKFLSNVLLI